MNCIIKSWRCSESGREEFIRKPKDRHFCNGSLCKGKWEEYEWRRKIKPIVREKHGKEVLG